MANESTPATRLLDELAPEGFDWEYLVREYPIPALLLAAAGGFILGQRHGREVVDALSEFAAGRVASHVNEMLGDEVLGPLSDRD